jgi:threonine dehydratase
MRAAAARLGALPLRTPLLPLAPPPAGGHQVFLKLENLQPTGSFKIRPIGSAVLARPAAVLARGIYTCSSGNSAVALAWMAQRASVPAAAIVTPATPEVKLARLRALGARIIAVSFETWWHAVQERRLAGEAGEYIDAVRDPPALAANGALGLEILESLPELEAIFVPFGGGALACGIGCAVRALGARTKVIACELESAQPLTAALRAGGIVSTEHDTGFVSGIGMHTVLPEVWPLARELLAGTLTVSLAQVAAAIRQLAQEHHVIAEGAGAIPVAAALSGSHPYRSVCAVVSGGNLDPAMLSTILAGGIPR